MRTENSAPLVGEELQHDLDELILANTSIPEPDRHAGIPGYFDTLQFQARTTWTAKQRVIRDHPDATSDIMTGLITVRSTDRARQTELTANEARAIAQRLLAGAEWLDEQARRRGFATPLPAETSAAGA